MLRGPRFERRAAVVGVCIFFPRDRLMYVFQAVFCDSKAPSSSSCDSRELQTVCRWFSLVVSLLFFSLRTCLQGAMRRAGRPPHSVSLSPSVTDRLHAGAQPGAGGARQQEASRGSKGTTAVPPCGNARCSVPRTQLGCLRFYEAILSDYMSPR